MKDYIICTEQLLFNARLGGCSVLFMHNVVKKLKTINSVELRIKEDNLGGKIMPAKQILLTSEGLSNLENELEELKTVRRKDVSEKIKVALSFGDLSENSEYDEAKNEQAMVEARINEIEQIFKNAVVLDEDGISTDSVNVGAVVMVKNLKSEKIDSYKIVGSTEASPANKKISDESPVGKAMIGHKVGDTVNVEAPSGLISYEILEISK